MTPEPWSPRVIIDRLGADEALARELVSLFLAEYPRMMSAIQESVASGRAEEVRRAAHALKGSVANFTEGTPMIAALELETLGREARLDDVPRVLARLEQAMSGFVMQLQQFMRS